MPGLVSPLSGVRAGGVVPAATSWDDIDGGYSASNAAKTISGIGETIMLRAEISSVSASGSAAANLYGSVNGALLGSIGIVNSASLDLTTPPDSSVFFTASGSGSSPGWTITCTVTVKYKSAGSSTFDQTLDTFTVTLTDPTV